MRNHTGLLSDETGTAFVETLVTLPLLAIVLAGTLALNAMYGAKLEAKARARRIAWLQAESGDCAAHECVSASCAAIEADIRAGGLDGALSSRNGRFALGSFIGRIGRFLLGTITRGVGSAQAPLPRLVGSGRTSQHSVTTLLCNTTARRGEQDRSILDHACSTGLGATEYAREVCK